jgi:putative ABC transport system permease protein
MLNLLFKDQLQLGLVQAAVAAFAALIAILLARTQAVHLERDTVVALLRGAIQIVAVGSVLVILLPARRWTAGFMLAGIMVAAGATSQKRAKGLPGAFKVSTCSIAFGAGSVIAVMTWLG